MSEKDTSVIPTKPVQALVNFEIAYKQLMERWEDPHLTGKVTTDAGGKTKYGISQNSYPSLDIDSLTAEHAKKIAYTDYWMYSKWDISDLSKNSQPLANKLFQFGFNVGVGTVVQIGRMLLHVVFQNKQLPTLNEPLIVKNLMNGDEVNFISALVGAQLSRYVKDYHLLSRVPHSLLDRALCIE